MTADTGAATPEASTVRVVVHSGEQIIAISELHDACAWYWQVGPWLVIGMEALTLLLATALFGWRFVGSSFAGWLVPLAAAGGIGAWAFPTQLKYFQKVMRWGIKCPACQHYVGHDAEWKCGHCGHENLKDSGKLGLFAGCWECRCRPKSVECPGCRQILYLDLDADARNPARLMESLPVEVPAPVEPTAEETEKVEHTMQVEKLQRERELLRARMLTDTVRHQAGKVASRLQEEDTSTILERNVKKWTESIHDQIMAAAQLTIQAEQFKKELSNQPGFSALPEKAQRNLLFSVDEAVGKTIRQQSQKPKT